MRGADLMQDSKHGAIRLASARGRANEHILCAEERGLAHAALDAVQAGHAAEGRLRPLWQLRDLHQLLVLAEWLGLERWHVHLLITLCVMQQAFRCLSLHTRRCTSSPPHDSQVPFTTKSLSSITKVPLIHDSTKHPAGQQSSFECMSGKQSVPIPTKKLKYAPSVSLHGGSNPPSGADIMPHLHGCAVGVLGQVTLLVAHEVAALVEGQAVNVQLVPPSCRADGGLHGARAPGRLP